MPKYTCVGYDKKGRKIRETIVSRSESDAKARFRLRGISITSVSSAGAASQISGGSIFGDVQRLMNIQNLIGKKKIPVGDIVIFTKQFATLIDAGIAIVASLTMLEAQTKLHQFKEIINHVREMVEGGKDLAAAMEKHPEAFDQTYCSLIRAGAASGQLDIMMKKISIYTEKAGKLRKQLKSAMSYPVAILALVVLMVIGMLKFVVPMFAKNFQEGGKELPSLTQFVVDMSDKLSNNFHYIIGFIAAIIFTFIRWKNTEVGSRQFDKIMLKAPIIGNVISKIAIARFTSTLSTLVSSGISLPEALKICSKAANNKIIEEEIIKIEGGITKGRTLSESMQKTPIFPNMVCGMINVGESTGRLDIMLDKIAAIYEEDVENTLAATLKLIEPLMFVIVGGIVGFFLIAMYLPIFDMASMAK